jgi:dethiobiotin synthetase
MRLYICGTDTDVGKTFVVRLLANAFGARERAVTVIKLVQTGVDPDESGDARTAVERTGQTALELERFRKPADPWSAAIAEGRAALTAADLAERVAKIAGDVLVEGSGGALVPINAEETISTVAERCGLDAAIVVGLRLGCISHALLTEHYLRGRGIRTCGFVLVDRWGSGDAYAREVENVLASRGPVLGMIPYIETGDPSPATGELLLRALLETRS